MDSSNPRFSLDAWKLYEPYIAMWMEHYPNAFSFEPQGRSPITVVARIRDAVKAQLAFSYETTIPNIVALSDMWRSVVVTIDRRNAKAVRIGPKEGKVTIEGLSSKPSSHVSGLQLFQPTLDDLVSIAHLLNRGILTTEVRVIDCTPVIREAFHSLVEARFPNVGLTNIQDRDFIIL